MAGPRADRNLKSKYSDGVDHFSIDESERIGKPRRPVKSDVRSSSAGGRGAAQAPHSSPYQVA
ncbi:MAG: hypothetical protein MI923_27730 [Phycisphaerales bacterium]|nr:hypothetical protein [Phycisphaerales bacterium]